MPAGITTPIAAFVPDVGFAVFLPVVALGEVRVDVRMIVEEPFVTGVGEGREAIDETAVAGLRDTGNSRSQVENPKKLLKDEKPVIDAAESFTFEGIIYEKGVCNAMGSPLLIVQVPSLRSFDVSEYAS